MGLVVPAVPGRGAGRRGGGGAARATRRSSSGSTSGTPRRSRPRASCGASRCPTPPSTRPTARRCSRFSGTLTAATRSRASSVLDDEGRVAASILGELPSTTTLVELTEDVVAESRRAAMGDWFSEQTASSGSLAAGDPGRAGRGAGLVLLAVRDPAAARLPLLRHRALRRRPRAGAPRPDAARVDPVRARLHRRLRALRRPLRGRRRRGCSTWRRETHRRPGVGHDRASGSSSPGWSRGSSGTGGCTRCRPSGWRPRRCWASCSGWAGRPASAPRSARSTPCPSPTRPRVAARCCRRSTRSVSGCRSSSPGSPTGGRSAPSPSSAATSSGWPGSAA